MNTGLFAGAGALWMIAVIILAIVWIILPFAIFGTKPLLHRLIAEQKKTNSLLERLAEHDKPHGPQK